MKGQYTLSSTILQYTPLTAGLHSAYKQPIYGCGDQLAAARDLWDYVIVSGNIPILISISPSEPHVCVPLLFRAWTEAYLANRSGVLVHEEHPLG